jgi:hypothetical protein
MNPPIQVLNRRGWFEQWATRTITNMMTKKLTRHLARVEKHLVQAEWELVAMGFLQHDSDKKQVQLRRSIRAAQRSLIDYKRATSLMTDENHQQQALGLRQEAA